MWPIFLYMTKDECLRGLRQLELDAYSMLVSALRAQGPLTCDKRNLLRDAGKMLNINTDRHKCEVRRAVNDEKLNTIASAIAYQVNGLDVSIEDWCQEGRRVMPMLQRISPHTLHPILTEDAHKYPEAQPGSEGSSNNLDMLEKPPINSARGFRSGDALDPDKPYTAKKAPNQNHKVMVVSNAETSATNSILHKTLSVPISKITKLNLDKFKIVPSSFSSALQVSGNKNFISKTGKRIIPLSQLQMLNHKFSSKGGIKVLPISSKILGKNITMTRITNKKVPALSKIKVENIEFLHEISSEMEQQPSTEPNKAVMENENGKTEEVVVDEVDVEHCDEVSDSKSALIEPDKAEPSD